MYKIKIFKNWPGETCFFQKVANEEIVGLYINENETRPLEKLLESLMKQLKAREIKICMD